MYRRPSLINKTISSVSRQAVLITPVVVIHDNMIHVLFSLTFSYLRRLFEMVIVLLRHDLEQSEEVNQRMTDPP